ncbi:sigma-70 family RNA polymerase sigma factor [Chitinophaga varians]|uniref:Sigma-70 family RNA polymerase sigma factor n=1 Tax=Chitinophaga varians TaxID=2202339 RepID=A0A847RR88_9BACT|nr:sigma-70 family RNA polymerase sigma factor [Chitinophaga varians]NLR63327.1 sigma-70 family RNA polymerase sigma factor [Chitinophaga varians]
MPDISSYNGKEFLNAIAGGDELAYAQLYRHYWNEVYSLALSFLKSPALAEDTIQEVFVKLWLKKENIPEWKDFRAYFMTMVRHEIINTMRQGRRQMLIRDLGPGEDVAAPSPQEALLQHKEAAGLIQTALNGLSAKQREAFLLSRTNGLSHDQIAAHMQLSKKTVANLITLALNHIRDFLNQQGYLTELLLVAVCLFFEK